MATTLSDTKRQELEAIAKRIRRHIIASTTKAGSGHPSSSLSAVEIAVTLFFGGVMRYRPQEPGWPDRDRFILSKGHAAPLLYAVLAEAGYFPVEELQTLRRIGSPLEGHPNRKRLPAVEASTGSLGQGLSIGLGHALAARLDGRDYRVYVLLGDGEIDEGQVWEAAAAARKYQVSNLIAIIDHNGYQQTGPTSEVLDMEPIAEKWRTFGWDVQEIDGHDLDALAAAFAHATAAEAPSVIVARTVKGKGIESVLKELKDENMHGKPLPEEAAQKALALLS